jgi:hypothetical protein
VFCFIRRNLRPRLGFHSGLYFTIHMSEWSSQFPSVNVGPECLKRANFSKDPLDLFDIYIYTHPGQKTNKLHGLSPRANYTDQATAACRRSDCKLLPIEGGRGQRDGSLQPYSRFSRQEPLLFYQVAPQLYSQGWVDPVPDPVLFFSSSAGNRTRDSGSVAKNSDH